MTRCQILGCAAAVLLSMAGCSSRNKEITLRLKFEPGTATTYAQTTKRMATVYEADSVTKSENNTFDMTIAQKVTEIVDDTLARIIQTDTYTMTQANADDSTRIDTITHSREMVMVVSPSGRVIDLEFTDSDNLTMITYVESYVEQGIPIFPSSRLAVGESWKQNATVLMPDETFTASTEYRVASLARESGYDCAVIEFDGNLVIPIEPNPGDSVTWQGIDKVTTSGTIYFAYADGLIVKQIEDWRIDGRRTAIRAAGDTSHYRIDARTTFDSRLQSVTRE